MLHLGKSLFVFSTILMFVPLLFIPFSNPVFCTFNCSFSYHPLPCSHYDYHFIPILILLFFSYLSLSFSVSWFFYQPCVLTSGPVYKVGKPADVAHVAGYLGTPERGWVSGRCISVNRVSLFPSPLR